jgi:FkbM family methyltransferase
MIHIKNLVLALGLPIRGLIAEVGVNSPSLCRVDDFIKEGHKVILVEPLHRHAQELRERYAAYDVQVIEKAIVDEPGPAFLVDRDQSSFILLQSTPNTPSLAKEDYYVFTSEAEDMTLVTKLTPAIANDGALTQENDFLEVEGITFDTIDPEDIDILLVDVEGAEYFVIKHLRSRPKIIVLETHDGNYINPYMSEIDHWMATNDYARVLCDESDTLWIKR